MNTFLLIRQLAQRLELRVYSKYFKKLQLQANHEMELKKESIRLYNINWIMHPEP